MAGFPTRPTSKPASLPQQSPPTTPPTPARVAAAVAAKNAKPAPPPPPAPLEPIADQNGQFPDELVEQFQAAREVITAQIQALLIKAQPLSEKDEAQYQQLHEQVEQLSRQRGALAIGSPQVSEVLEAEREQRQAQLQAPAVSDQAENS